MKFYHLIVAEHVVLSTIIASEIMNMVTDLHLERGEYEVAISFEPS